MRLTKCVFLWILILSLSVILISACNSGNGDGNSDGGEVDIPEAADFDSFNQNLTIDYSQATQLPLTGYFSKSMDSSTGASSTRAEGRSLKVYISEDAPIRSKWIVVAVPDDVETYTFLYQQGWIALADKKGEAILALEPGEGGWGTVAEEQEYIDNAMSFLRSGRNDNNQSVFSTYGVFYFVGYETGCAPLESWAAEYPIYVISQVYIKGTSAGQTCLDTAGAVEYNGKNTSGFDDGPDDNEFRATLLQLGYDGTFITRSEVPVPSWFAGYAEDDYSLTYWKNANDVLDEPDGNVYHQNIYSDAWQTRYANECILNDHPLTDYGISQVKVTSTTDHKASEIYDFLSIFIRYDNTFAYSNHLDYRLNYSEMLVSTQHEAANGVQETKSVTTVDGTTVPYEVYTQQATRVTAYNDPNSGTMIAGVFALDDYNSDSVLDPRDYLIYIPDNAADIWGAQGAPVVIVHPGNSQTASIFMDCSVWWQVANDEGCVVAIVGEKYGSATSVTYPGIEQSVNFDYVLCDILKNTIAIDYLPLDFTRIYASGQSAGSSASQTMALMATDLYAAVASTSFAVSNVSDATGELIPIYLLHGQSDLGLLLPDLWGSSGLQQWAQNFFTVNGLDTDIDSFNQSNTIGRFHDYIWNNTQGIPLVKYGYTLARPHNNMPQESLKCWEYLKHYSFTRDSDGDVTARYYSHSGFRYGDDILIVKDTIGP